MDYGNFKILKYNSMVLYFYNYYLIRVLTVCVSIFRFSNYPTTMNCTTYTTIYISHCIALLHRRPNTRFRSVRVRKSFYSEPILNDISINTNKILVSIHYLIITMSTTVQHYNKVLKYTICEKKKNMNKNIFETHV